jgi:hypothetical protein
MAGNSDPKPSFTAGRKWGMALHVFILVLVVFSVVAMANYLSRDFYLRSNWSTHTKWQLSPRTVQYIASITNRVHVTVYYRKDDQLFSTIIELLKEYKGLNHRIDIETVDYQRDPATAQKIKTRYKLGAASEKDLVIFDSAGVVFPVEGKWLADREIETVQGGKEPSYRYKITGFRGETLFTGAFMKVTSPVRRKAYLLQGHGEHRMDSSQEHFGYIKFASAVGRNCVEVQPLSLLGTNPVPADCDLLIIAGPSVALADSELEKIDKYLDQGGRLFSLFDADSLHKVTGLEKILAKWGVTVGTFVVRDPAHSVKGADIAVGSFSKHVMVNPLVGSGLDLIQPRPIRGAKERARAADAPRVEEVAFTSDDAFADADPSRKHTRFPLIVTVEKGAIEGVTGGTTRIVVVGDSYFLSDEMIDVGANADFVDGAINWLLDRPELLKGIGPRHVDTYLLEMTSSQMQVAQLVLLAAMPGSVLALGVLVWLSRRK